MSEHTPLFFNTGEPSSLSNHTQFRFELYWLLRDGFIEMIKELWCNTEAEGSSMEIWQTKIHRVRQFLRGWAKNMSEKNRKEKKEILNTLDKLDKKLKIHR
jgi:hypothetical protein